MTVLADIARSWLLWPASRLASVPTGADALVLDLEDAIEDEEKALARTAVAAHLRGAKAWVRINDAASPHFRDDLAAVRSLPGLLGVVLAKAESASDVGAAAVALGEQVPIVPMVESAASLLAAESIAAHPATFRLAFGSGDFRRDTGIADDPVALAFARSRLVVASIAARRPAPIDGPYRGDRVVAAAGVAHARVMGMTGCLVLEPDNLGVINRGFSPSDDDVAWASAVLAAPPGAQRDGSYRPLLARARAVLDHDRRLALVRE